MFRKSKRLFGCCFQDLPLLQIIKNVIINFTLINLLILDDVFFKEVGHDFQFEYIMK